MLQRISVRVISRLRLRRLRIVCIVRVSVSRGHGLSRRWTRLWLLRVARHVLLLLVVVLRLLPASIDERLLRGGE